MLQPGPALPLENAGKIPDARQAFTVARYQVSPPPPPQELLTMFGRRSGRGFAPARSVGARIHWPEASSAASEQLLLSQPFAAIHRAPGATPIWLPAPSSPSIVPMVWVPWLLLSHGASGRGAADAGRVEPVVVVVERAAAVLPRYLPTSAGWSKSTPVSMFATVMPSPRTPKVDHTSSALIRSMPHSTASIVFSALPAAGFGSAYVSGERSRVTLPCAARARASVSLPPRTRIVFATQNGSYAVRASVSCLRTSLWLASAVRLRASTTALPRWSQSAIVAAADRSACSLNST